MATVTTPEHVEAHTAPVAEKPSRVEVRKVAIDNSTLSVLAVGVALFALAFGAFTHLSGRIENLSGHMDNLSGRVDNLSGRMDNLSGRMDNLDAKIDKVATELRGEMKRYAERTDDKIDRLTEKINELLIAQNRDK